jgi:integrase
MSTLKQRLDEYVLYHDLAAETVKWYRRIVSVFCTWAGGDVPLDRFDGTAISRLLADKKALGRSPYYIRSLRNGLVAVLHDVRGNGPVERIRGVRCPPLQPEAWTPGEVEKLIADGCRGMPYDSLWRWQLCIALAYYTGLDRCDIEKLERRHFGPDGAVFYNRSKTGGEPTSGIPVELLAFIDSRCPGKGPILRMGIGPEWFRKIFAKIVERAGLHGTFKKLRKSSGSLVEKSQPGKGHKHLGNSRAIFEKHYEARRMTRGDATLPPTIRLPLTG